MNFTIKQIVIINNKICIFPTNPILFSNCPNRITSRTKYYLPICIPKQSKVRGLRKLHIFCSGRLYFICWFFWIFTNHCFLWCCLCKFGLFRKRSWLRQDRRGFLLLLVRIGARFVRMLITYRLIFLIM